jgi:hypothetical protein
MIRRKLGTVEIEQAERRYLMKCGIQQAGVELLIGMSDDCLISICWKSDAL